MKSEILPSRRRLLFRYLEVRRVLFWALQDFDGFYMRCAGPSTHLFRVVLGHSCGSVSRVWLDWFPFG